MKVFRNSGRVSDVLESDAGHSTNSEEIERLIIRADRKNKWAQGLRVVFFSLLLAALIFIFAFIARSHIIHPLSSVKPSLDFNATYHSLAQDVCSFDKNWRFDCFPEKGATEKACKARGCCWSPIEPRSEEPWCFFPQGSPHYKFSNFSSTLYGLTGLAKLVKKSPYPNDSKLLRVNVFYETESVIRIKITDEKNPRFEVPLHYNNSEAKKPSERDLKYTFLGLRNGFKIFKKGSAFPLFDSTVAPIFYADQFLQISTTLTSKYIYGFGEAVDNLKRDVNWKKYVLYNHDRIPAKSSNNYGSHPFYMVVDKLGNSYGVFLANSNAMEIEVQPAPALTFRTIGGILDLRVFIGPTPSDVIDQYTNVIGRPVLPPYWGLGFHLCRFNYGSVNHTAAILRNNLNAGIPIDVQWNDLDYMHHQNDFTYDPVKFAGLPEFIEYLHSNGMRYIPLIDPGISGGEGKGKYQPYDEGLNLDIFIKNSEGSPFIGKVWNPKSTVWPDFSHPNVTKYWMDQLESFRKKIPLDGAWIDMNEPSNFWDGTSKGCSENSTLDHPPYVPEVDGNKLYYKTICPSAIQAGGRHYDLHNLYGTQETIVTYKVLGDLTQQRPFIISRSTFPGQGKYGGHWTGDVVSNWEDMIQTIPQILSFGLYGIPLVGADICGFNGNTTVELCKRWMQLGALYPFSRNHNTDDGIPQDPASLGPEVIAASKEMLTIRYLLLPYLYTLFFRAHLTGQPVARPLFFEFPNDINTFELDRQFMLGDSILVIPILEKSFDSLTISTYLPEGWWYSHHHAGIIESYGELRDVPVAENSIPVLYRGGSVVVMQKPAMNTVASRKNKFYIHAFLTKSFEAKGEWFWDDGVSNSPDVLVSYNHWEFLIQRNEFTMKPVVYDYPCNLTLGQIVIHGILGTVQSVILQNQPYNFTLVNQTLTVNNLSLTGSVWTYGFVLKWS